MTFLDRWRGRARQLKRDAYTLHLACRDPRVPWYAKALAACVAAFSPLDLIPDANPVLGYRDDLVLVPLGVLLEGGSPPPDRRPATCHAEACPL